MHQVLGLIHETQHFGQQPVAAGACCGTRDVKATVFFAFVEAVAQRCEEGLARGSLIEAEGTRKAGQVGDSGSGYRLRNQSRVPLHLEQREKAQERQKRRAAAGRGGFTQEVTHLCHQVFGQVCAVGVPFDECARKAPGGRSAYALEKCPPRSREHSRRRIGCKRDAALRAVGDRLCIVEHIGKRKIIRGADFHGKVASFPGPVREQPIAAIAKEKRRGACRFRERPHKMACAQAVREAVQYGKGGLWRTINYLRAIDNYGRNPGRECLDAHLGKFSAFARQLLCVEMDVYALLPGLMGNCAQRIYGPGIEHATAEHHIGRLCLRKNGRKCLRRIHRCGHHTGNTGGIEGLARGIVTVLLLLDADVPAVYVFTKALRQCRSPAALLWRCSRRQRDNELVPRVKHGGGLFHSVLAIAGEAHPGHANAVERQQCALVHPIERHGHRQRIGSARPIDAAEMPRSVLRARGGVDPHTDFIEPPFPRPTFEGPPIGALFGEAALRQGEGGSFGVSLAVHIQPDARRHGFRCTQLDNERVIHVHEWRRLVGGEFHLHHRVQGDGKQ